MRVAILWGGLALTLKRYGRRGVRLAVQLYRLYPRAVGCASGRLLCFHFVTRVFSGVFRRGSADRQPAIFRCSDLISSATGSRFQIGNGTLSFRDCSTAKDSLIQLNGASSAFDLRSYTGTTDFSIAILKGAAGNVLLGGNKLVIDGADPSSFGGAIQGTGAVVRDGSGTLTLSGASTYTGVLSSMAAWSLSVRITILARRLV